MSLVKLTSRILIAAFIVVLLPVSNRGQGTPWYTIPLPVPNGFVDVVTGNVHLEISLGSMPQRNGDPIVSKMVYDTTSYTYSFGLWNANGPGWGSIVGSSHTVLNVGAPGSGQSCTSFGLNTYPNGSVVTWTGFWFIDIHGTKHVAQSGGGYETRKVNCSDNFGHSFGNSMDIASISLADQDLLGFTFQISSYNQMIIYAPDGTLLIDNTTDKFPNGLPIDPNGNIGSPQGSQPNLAGLPSGFLCGSSTVTTSSGSPATYTGTCTNQNVSNVINGTTYTGTVSLLSSLTLPDGTSYSFSYDTGTTGNHYGTLTGVTLPAGGTISFTYTGFPASGLQAAAAAFGGGTWSLSYSVINGKNVTTVLAPSRYDSASHTNVNDQAVFTMVNTIPGLILQTAQYYSGTSTLLKTVTYNPSADFPSTVTTTLNDTGQSSQVSYQYGPCRDCITQKQETDFSGTIVRTTKTTYTSGTFIKPASVNVYAGSGTGSPVASTLYTYDEYSANYCKNGVPMLASFTGAYRHDDTNFGTSYTARGNVTTIQRLISGTTYATTHMCYDTLGNVTQTVDANGNPTSYDYSENWTDTYCIPSGTITHAFPTTITDALGHRTKKSFFSCTVLPQSVKDENDIQAGRNGTTFTYELLNRPLTVNFPDGGQTTYCYSHNSSLPCYTTSLPPFSTESRLISGSTTLNTKTLLDSYDRVAETQLTSDPLGTIKTDTTYDALGHVSTVSNPYRSTSDSTYGITTYDYDALGRATLVIPPDGTASANNVATAYAGNCTTVTDETAKTRKSCVDALGRLTQAFEDPGSSPHLNFETDYQYDALNNLLCVAQKGTNSGTFSNCASIPSTWRPRYFNYDSLSRLTSSTNPESNYTWPTPPATPVAVPTTYTYDANGNLLSKTSPAPNQPGAATVTLSYCYDALNRLVSKAYTSQSCPMSSPVSMFTYDLSSIDGDPNFQNPIGRLIKTDQVLAPGIVANAWLDYDPMGRVFHLAQCARYNCGPFGSNPNWWIVTNTYDLAGDLTSYTDAFGHLFTQKFDTAARPWMLTSNWVDATHPQNLYTVGSSTQPNYNPAGGVNTALLGNNLTAAYAYNNRLQPCRMDWNTSAQSLANCGSSTPSSSILDFTYGYNASTSNNGNIASWTAAGQQSFARSYTYDSLNRLSAMSSPADPSGCTGLSWSYDPWGNRTSQTVTGGACNSETLTTFTTQNQFPTAAGYSYDSAGNMTLDGVNYYFYDPENRLAELYPKLSYPYLGTQPPACSSSGAACYFYNAEGQRIAKYMQGGAAATFYLYGSDGEVVADTDGNQNWNQTYIHFGGQLIAQYRGTATGFLIKDHLGSTRLDTLSPWVSPSQSVYDNMDYLPFGEQIAGNSATSHKFTGKERDAESGLDNFEARYNSSSVGRFMSPDPRNAGAKLLAPQSWNAYSYVWNNPINAIDPDGLECIDFTGGEWPAAIPVSSFRLNCGDKPSPPIPSPDKEEKLSIKCVDALDPCMAGNVSGNSQPNLAAMKFQGPGGSLIGGYGGFNVFGALDCVAENDPTDSACWGVKQTLRGGMFQWSWSLDAYATAAEKPIKYQQQGGQLKPIIPVPDPLDPSSRLIDVKPSPLPTPTAKSYTCPAIARELGFQSGSPQNLAALRTLYQTLCR